MGGNSRRCRDRHHVNTTTVRLGAGALVAGTALNLLRMLPIFLSGGFSFDELPPSNAAEAAKTATLSGWYLSHVMAIVSIPLLIFGFLTIYQWIRDTSDNPAAERVTFAGFFGITTGLILYLVAAVTDGIALRKAADHYFDAAEAERETAGAILMSIHETAASFGGHFMAAALISTGIFALGMLLARCATVVAKIGIAIGVLGLVGSVTGLLDLSFQERFPLLGGIVAVMMIWWIALAYTSVHQVVQPEPA